MHKLAHCLRLMVPLHVVRYKSSVYMHDAMLRNGSTDHPNHYDMNIINNMNLVQPKQELRQKLILHEQQAYEGARMFFYAVIPISMLFVVGAAAFVVYKCGKLEMGNQGWQLMMVLGVLIVGGGVYVWSLKYYLMCAQVSTTPIISKHQHSEVIQHPVDNLQAEETLLGSTKPKQVYCHQCQILCHYRTRHCRKCQVCIQRYDHHCFWLGNCVGRHNHKQFYYFLLLQTINNSLNYVSLYKLADVAQHYNMQLPNWLNLIRLGLEGLALGFLCFTGYLFFYHCMLISNGMTTWEHMRRSRISYLKYLPAGFNPFSKGVVNNWKLFLSQKTKMDGSSELQEWDQLIPTYEQAKQLKPVCNLIQNQYYSCC